MKQSLLVPMIGVAVLAIASPAAAQFGARGSRPRIGYADEARQPFYEARRAAHDNGYREGLKEGEKDGRKRDAFDFRDEKDWRKADKGYHRTYGDRERYRVAFRAGFEAGYADGYRRHAGGYYGYPDDRAPGRGRAIPRGSRAPYPSYPGSRGPYPTYPSDRSGYPGDYGYGYGFNPAQENGYRDGFEKGRDDARDRRAYDPIRHGWYRSGDRHYRREYGSKERYEDIYRHAFREGYDRGYREWSYRR